jgi:hypothetical protein
VASLLDIYFIRQFFHLRTGFTRYQSWQPERWWRSQRSCFNRWHRNPHYRNWLRSLFLFFRRSGALGLQRACPWSIFATGSDASAGGDRTVCGNLYHREALVPMCSITVLGTT